MTKHLRGSRWWTLGFFLVLLTSGCNGTPVSPTPSPPPPTGGPQPKPVLPQVTNESSASVTVEDPFGQIHGDGPAFWYEVRFLLRETGGKSGATIKRIDVYGLTGIDQAGPECWRQTPRVPPLGSLDTFYTGTDDLTYCGPISNGETASPLLDVIVTFTDDFGITGAISFPIASFR